MSDPVSNAERDVQVAWNNLSAELHDAVNPGIDIAKLIDALDEYIVARVVLMKLDY